MKLIDTRLSQAGLLRCCTSGFEDMADDVEVNEGQHIPCKAHNDGKDSGVVLHDGVWLPQWVYNRDFTNSNSDSRNDEV